LEDLFEKATDILFQRQEQADYFKKRANN